MHTIANRVAENFIEITVTGFWSIDHIADFVDDLRNAIREFPGLTNTPPMSLYNYTDAAIQPQDVVAAMQAMASSAEFGGRKVALYTEGAFARLQAKRVAAAGRCDRLFAWV